jgi:hypothetical protein
MRYVVLAGLVLLGGCISDGVTTIAKTDTAVTLRFSRRTPLQQAENIATTHCESGGLVPRLAQTNFNGDYFQYRYECVALKK